MATVALLFWVPRNLTLRGPVASEHSRGRAREAKRQVDGSKGRCGAATAIILPLDMTNHLALIKTSDVTNIAGVSSRSKNRGAMRSGRSSLPTRRAGPRSLRTILGPIGDCRRRGSLGVVEPRFGDHTEPRDCRRGPLLHGREGHKYCRNRFAPTSLTTCLKYGYGTVICAGTDDPRTSASKPGNRLALCSNTLR